MVLLIKGNYKINNTSQKLIEHNIKMNLVPRYRSQFYVTCPTTCMNIEIHPLRLKLDENKVIQALG